MGKLAVFNSVSLDGYFTGPNGELDWAHRAESDPEFDAFVEGNAQGGGVMVFGRVTYQMMESYWPTPMASENDPVVAKQMNEMKKIVFSRTLKEVSWKNTEILHGDPAAEMRRLKQSGDEMTILGSGSIVAQLTRARLIDEYQFVVVPVVLGAGRTMFEGVEGNLAMKLASSRSFSKGNVLLSYVPAG